MTKLLQKLHFPAWLVGILALVLVLRIPSFLEPYYYGDEMIYLTLGQGVKQGLTLYKDIHDNKPPLLYLTAAVAGNLFWFKVILAFWNLTTIFFFYKLAEKLFTKNDKLQKIATLIFALLTTLPLLEGNTVNAELFMITFTIGALLLVISEKLSFKKVYFAGFLLGLGTLFKVPAAFDAPVIVFYWLITTDLKNCKGVIKNVFILIAGFASPILLTFVWYFMQGALSEYIRAAFIQNVGYLSSFRPGDVPKPFYIRNFPLIFRAIVVFVGMLTLFVSRKKLSKNFILFCLWTLFGLFAVTLSERPYPHYFVQVVAPMSFLAAMFFAEKSVEQSLTVLPLLITFFVPVYYKFYHYSTISYYARFVDFATGKIDKGSYFRSFSETTVRNYKLAEFLAQSSKPTDRVFMWDSDSAIVYALSRRLPPIKYVADYHVSDFSTKSEVVTDLAKTNPKFIILTSGHPFPELAPLIKSRYLLITQIENSNVYSRINLLITK